MVPEFAPAFLQRLAAFLPGVDGEAAGVLAFRVVGAANEATVPPELQAQAPGVASRAEPRVGAVGRRREEVCAEVGVERVDHVGDFQLAGLFHGEAELIPERLHHRPPIGPAAADVVQLLLEPGGEPGIDIALEKAGEERRDQAPAILGNKALGLHTDVLTVPQDRQDAGIGARPADAELLHFLDQAGLGEARWRLGEMLIGVYALAADRVLLVHRRQHPALIGGARPLGRVVHVLTIQLEVAVEGDDRAVGTQFCAVASEIDRDLVQLGRLHLARDRALPHELVQPLLFRREIARDLSGVRLTSVGRTASCASWAFLALLLYSRGASRDVVGTVAAGDVLTDRHHRLARHLHAVGAHVGDEARRLAIELHAFIKLLGASHRRLGAHAELAAGLLLQGAGGERRWRVSLHALALHLRHGERPGLHLPLGGERQRVGVEVEAGRGLLAVEMGEASLQRLLRLAVPNAARRSVQYSRGLERPRSRPRARRSGATPRIARGRPLRLPGSLRHSTGESVKPTR